jgi:transketolase
MSKVLNANPDSILLLGDIGVHGFKDAKASNPDRVINAGIMEQSMIGLASGLAIKGFIPTVHSIAPFLVLRALEQIRIDLVYQQLNCNIVTVGGSYDYSMLGATHHCPEDIAILLSLGEVNIYTPSNGESFETLFVEEYMNGINYFRISDFECTSRKKYSLDKYLHVMNECHGEVKATILVFGNFLDRVLQATRDLDVLVISAEKVSPLDFNLFARAIQGRKLIVIEPWQQASSFPIFQSLIKDGWRVDFIGYPRNVNRSNYSIADFDKKVNLDIEGIRKEIVGICNG